MPTNRERILDYLSRHPQGADDDQIAAALGIGQRQQVNQICRGLAASGIIARSADHLSEKLVNRHIASTVAAPAAPPMAQLVAAPVRSSRLVSLDDQAALLKFAYTGEVGLTEDQVKGAIESALGADGWKTTVMWGHAHGIDVEATRGADHLVLEAKGEGSLSPMRVNYFLGALGELLQRMDSPDAFYGLALPAHRQFVGLIDRLPTWVRGRLNLRFYLVRPAADGTHDVGLVLPDAPKA